MKLIDIQKSEYAPMAGLYIDFFKFRRRSLISISKERESGIDSPALLIQFGGGEIFYISLHIFAVALSFSIYSRHYD